MEPAHNTEALLIERLQQSDEAAFVEIYDRYWERVFLAAYQRTKSKEISEELVQNLFLKLWEKRTSLQIRQLEHYLFRSIKHGVLDYIDAQQVSDKYRKQFSSLLEGNEETTDQMVALEEVSTAIQEGMARLPEKSQQIFRLSKVNQWPNGKIAKHLHLSEKAVQYHLTKSMKFMRLYLKEFTFLLLLFF